ncbi:type II toxin-antitoxin system RelE/ParE family toxin [Phyllobacterium sp. YR620]|uniref:type II toxin-antitoxin system RelE/ParE family toxin n=1 Tax=Phyllobacterium sp. YR620 TaxID=1881066 RepID=UPI00244EAA4C|nr:type II toxin-antitoxin system RelE/ParE family toxin [Phyllobacterium sp. YR620]
MAEERGSPANRNVTHLTRVASILAALDSAEALHDMDRPSLKLHPLKGDRSGRWAVTVLANWRITFSMSERNVFDVDFEDYH